MRIRLPIGRALFLLALFLFFLLALLPLRLALDGFGFDRSGLSARAVTGSLWRGAIQEARLGPVALGDLGAELELLPLLLGRARLAFHSPASPGLEGAVVVSRDGFAVENVSGSFALGGLSPALPMSTIQLDDFSAAFDSGRCVGAGGRARATVAGPVAAIGVGSGFEGRARCAGDALLLPLAGPSGQERLTIRLFADGRYRIELHLRLSDPALRDRLVAFGFGPSGSGHAIRIDGEF